MFLLPTVENPAFKDYKEQILVKYSLEKLNKSQRMRFYYSLYGRTKKDKGMVDELKLNKFSREVLICSPEHIKELRDYLSGWNIEFKEVRMLGNKKDLK